jgi:hydrogenase maturation protein HypF
MPQALLSIDPGNVAPETRRFLLGGRVQGAGFRPFVYRIAHRGGLSGWVRNLAGRVEILAQGDPAALDRFAAALLTEAPPLARPTLLSVERSAMERPVAGGFAILASEADRPAEIHVPPDQFTCDDCLRELADPADRRFGYPFINCTQCGPRYSIITRLPYDRANTTMAGFPLCPDCAAEYADPLDRRFHAEPIACAVCGPVLRYTNKDDPDAAGPEALDACVAALRAGAVVAVKGIGGYHLVCDAANADAVATLRRRKGRPHKPLAVLVPDLGALRRMAEVSQIEAHLLADPMRPVMLLRRRADAALPNGIAPGLDEIGAMLPYSPLHHLLLQRHGGPLVATSANPSGEPVLTDNAEVEARLGAVVDGLLHHDRPIARPADDPVYRVIAGKPRPLRIGRGNAPAELELPFDLPCPTLALGGQMKTTVALGWGRRVVVSPHLGDMDTPRGLALLQQAAADLQALYATRAEALCCDAHPGFAGTRLARRWGLPVRRVFHHAAHASALAGEHPDDAAWIVFVWDGAGLGPDGAIWGGEALVGRPGQWRRGATFRPFSLLGGDRAARQPWRSALALNWEAGIDWPDCGEDVRLLRHAWEHGVNCPRTSSVGRLFDAAAAMLGLVTNASFEAQAPMYLEAAATPDGEPVVLGLARGDDGVWRTDWAPLLPRLRDAALAIPARAALFHATLAHALLAQARALRAELGLCRLGLTGGVFQNRVLSEHVLRIAEADGFTVVLPEMLPCNDAGLSFGQLIEAAACR